MSNVLINQVAASSLPPTPRLVAYVLANRANAETGLCNPSVDTISLETGLTTRGVRKAMAWMRTESLLRVVATNKSNHYTLTLPAINWDEQGSSEQGSGLNDIPQTPEQGSATPEPRSENPEPRSAKPKEPKRTQSLTQIDNRKKSSAVSKESKRDRIQKDIAEANAVTLPEGTTPQEVLEMWNEWQAYRSDRATDQIKPLPWNARAARMESASIQKALTQFPPDQVAEQIRTAISRNWQGAGMNYLKNESATPTHSRNQRTNANNSTPTTNLEEKYAHGT